MATNQLRQVIQHLRTVTLHHDGAGLTDGQLLESYVRNREEAAFAALVRRHGPMVWGVCLRVLRRYHDAEDAFQATFLVLVRKAASVLPREMVANWLYGVAHQTALKARATAAKRRVRERQMTRMPEQAAAEQDLWLDQELSLLPAKYRTVIVLCDLEGKTRKQVARQLDLPEGTVASRLATARTMLAKRLTRHGLALSGAALAAMLSQTAASACVPTSVMISTIKVGSLLAAGQAAGVISVRVALLTEGVIRTMLLSKLKTTTALFLAAGVVTASVSLVMFPVLAIEPPQPPKTNRPATLDGGEPQTAPKSVIIRTDASVRRLAWSPDGQVVATVGRTYEPIELRDIAGKNPKTSLFPISTVKLWDARTGKLKQSLGAEKKTAIRDIAFSPDRKTAAIAVYKFPEKMFSRWVQTFPGDGPPEGKLEVRIMDGGTWTLKRTIQVNGGTLQALAFSPDGKTVAFGPCGRFIVGDSDVNLYDVQNEKIKGGTKFAAPTRPIPGEVVFHLAFSPNGKVLAAGDGGGRVRLFDGQTGEVMQVLDAHRGVVRGIAFSPDGKTLASVSEDKTVKLWDVQAGKLPRTLQGNKGVLAASSFSPDGRLLATGGTVIENGLAEVILWNATTGELKQTLPDQPVFVNTLAFSPDGKTLAVGSGKGGDLKKDGGKTTGEMKLVRVE